MVIKTNNTESNPNFCLSIVLVKKKDDSFRLLVDYYELTSKTCKLQFPLLVIDDVLGQFQTDLRLSILKMHFSIYKWTKILENIHLLSHIQTNMSSYLYALVSLFKSSVSKIYL